MIITQDRVHSFYWFSFLFVFFFRSHRQRWIYRLMIISSTHHRWFILTAFNELLVEELIKQLLSIFDLLHGWLFPKASWTFWSNGSKIRWYSNLTTIEFWFRYKLLFGFFCLINWILDGGVYWVTKSVACSGCVYDSNWSWISWHNKITLLKLTAIMA